MFNDDKKQLILTHGIPGSGKSTFVSNHFGWRDTNIICPDDIRDEFQSQKSSWGDKFEYKIWKIVEERLIESLKNNRVTIIDATFISRKAILKHYKIAQQVDPRINFTIIDFSDMLLEDCLKNNLHRKETGGRFVPEDVIINMYNRIKRTKLLEFEPMTISHKDFGENECFCMNLC